MLNSAKKKGGEGGLPCNRSYEASKTLTPSVQISTALLFVPSKVTESEGNLGRKMAPDLD